jgi:hypothetical protein
MTKVSRTTIIEMCDIYDCDETVAEILRCSVPLVRAHRPYAKPKGKPRVRIGDRSIEAEPENEYRYFRSEEEKIRMGSRTLLIRQLEQGQHSLTPEKFRNVVLGLGLGDRLPRSMMA